MVIDLTDEAITKLLEKTTDNKNIKIGVKPTGCSGFKYLFDYLDGNPIEDDIEFNNYLSMLKFILIVANKLKVNRDDKSMVNMPNYLELESLSTNLSKKNRSFEIAFFPTRVLMQDFTGVPAVADLAAMRNALKTKNINPN